MDNMKYIPRLVDNKLDVYLKVSKAILITGPKWCGKTSTGLKHSKSVIRLTDKSTYDLAVTNPKYILLEDRPELIDEWQEVPSVWDTVRNSCDETSEKGQFILTGSTTLKNNSDYKIKHSGIGRIIKMNMYPMTAYEMGLSSDKVSLLDLKNNTVKECLTDKKTIFDLAEDIIRGGFPENISVPNEYSNILPKAYIEDLCTEGEEDSDDKRSINRKKLMILRSLARNESTITNDKKIINDIISLDIDDSEKTLYRLYLKDYMKVLEDLYVIWYQDAFSCNYRSSARIGVKAKRHFCDVSLASAALDLTSDKLIKDFNTFGFLFESMVERDLKVFMDYYGGNLFHFRDNNSGDEVDAIVEFSDGEYGAIEIKLTENGIDQAKKSLTRFYESVEKKPVFMAIVIGEYQVVKKDEETGIYILPFNAIGLNQNN